MADAPKRKRLEKTVSDPPPVGNQKFYCPRCGTAYSRQKGYFPVSHSPMYRMGGYLPWCSECVDEMYDEYRKKLGDDRRAMKRMCMKMDLYWSDSIFDMVERTAGVNSRIRSYIGKTNIIRYIDKTYDDTLQEEEKKGAAVSLAPAADADGEDEAGVDDELIEFWGTGYDADSYKDLDRRYTKWTSGVKNISPVHEALYKTICINEQIIARSGAKGDVADKAQKNMMDALSALNIKPSQVKNDSQDAEVEKMPLGVGIQTWEFHRPLPRTPEELKDQSRLKRNILTWFVGKTSKMVGAKNSYSRMYEEAMDKYRVRKPEYAGEDDDTILADIFGDGGDGG